MSKDKPTFVFHFHGSVGQQIAHIDNQYVSFDKDMNMHVANIESSNVPEHLNNDKSDYCEYICIEKLKEQGVYTLDEFETMFFNATKGTARELAAFLKRYQAQGLLNLKKHTKKQIFDNLRKHFPGMRDYDYPNFIAAY